MSMTRDGILPGDPPADASPAATSAEFFADRQAPAAEVELRQALCVAEAALAREKAWVERLMGDNSQLRRALRRFGMHKPGCKAIPGACTCGFAEVLK